VLKEQSLLRSAFRVAVPITSLLLIACSTPFQPLGVEELRDSIRLTEEQELGEAAQHPEKRQMLPNDNDVRDTLTPERLAELEELSGRSSYQGVSLDLGDDLLGTKSGEVGLTLRQAILAALKFNPDLQAARLTPAIREADLVSAEAAFDSTFFANYNLNWLDQPQVVPGTGTISFGTRANVVNVRTLETGVRKNLVSGGQMTVSTSLERSDNSSPGFSFSPDPAYTSSILLSVTQPLLRGFGSEVTLAEVHARRNQQRQEIEQLRSTTITLVTEVEKAYWTLMQARWNLLIRQRLLDRGIATREQLRGRLGFDVTPAEWSDAVARVETRKSDVISAKSLVRQASDALKLLMNHPDLPLGSETIVAPLDDFTQEPIEYSLLDAVTTSIEHRPEMKQALLNMDNAAIQVLVSNNARLPLLNLAASMQFNGLDDQWEESYDHVTSSRFIDYLVRLQFEYPLGNRSAEAQYRSARLQQNQAVLSYRNVLRQVVLDVKTALRDLNTNYQLLGQRDAARLAAAENLRTLKVQEEVQALTPEFLNLEFNRQELLASSELQQIDALVKYNISLANLHAAMGIALERNQIKFVVPDPDVR